jgi:hypothetical protein
MIPSHKLKIAVHCPLENNIEIELPPFNISYLPGIAKAQSGMRVSSGGKSLIQFLFGSSDDISPYKF